MAKIKFNRKVSWKRILSAVLVTVLVTSMLGVAISFLSKDTKYISPRFSVGGLSDNGVHIEDNKSLYTKKAFGCKGLHIEIDFEAHLTYDIYYYDVSEIFIGSIKGLSGTFSDKGDYPNARYCRIVIHPDIPAGTSESEFKVKWYEVYSYSKNMKISVSKKQVFDSENKLDGGTVLTNLYNDENALMDTFSSNYVPRPDASVGFFPTTDASTYSNYKCSQPIALDPSWKTVLITFKNPSKLWDTMPLFTATIVVDAILSPEIVWGEAVSSTADHGLGEMVNITVDLADLYSSYDSLYLYVQMDERLDCSINGF